ncbi:MAG: EAL and HDOD domain-containing protein [Gammaproteobacteria bacterium]
MIPDRLETEAAKAFIGRQPILNSKNGVCAYELLFRSGEVNAAGRLDGSKATAQVVYNTLLEMGLDDLVGPYLAFINFPRELLFDGIARLLPPDRVTIEILEDVKVDDKLVERVNLLSKQGFTIALDDFTYTPEWEPLLRLADIVKLDVFALSIEETQEHLELLRVYDVKLLAEKVETLQEYDTYRGMGFDYFQGYFFSKPEIVSKEILPDNHIALLQLLARLQDPDIDIGEVETLVSQTVSLSYKLFLYINSAYFGLPRKFDSIRQAVVYFGLQRLKDLACLIALVGINDKSSETILLGLTRAKMCEQLARMTRQPDVDIFFVIGLFSILEALLNHSLQEILQHLPLSKEVVGALLRYDGVPGEALQCSIACEQCKWPEIKFAKLDISSIHEAYTEAITWSRQTAAGLGAT